MVDSKITEEEEDLKISTNQNNDSNGDISEQAENRVSINWKNIPKSNKSEDSHHDGYNTIGSGSELSTSPPLSNTSNLTASGTVNKSLHRKNFSSLHRTPSFKAVIPNRRNSISDVKVERRANILREILSTEQAYISFLRVITDIYLYKIREKDILTQVDIENIFSNIDSIKSTHDEIHSKIKERIEFHQDNNTFPRKTIISDIFKEYGPFLKVYSIFVNNYYNNAMQLIKLHSTNNKKFKAYLQECKYSPNARKLDLNDLLIMPAQKIPRYILLLEELIQFTPKEDEEYQHLQEAKEVIKGIASFVNSSTTLEDKSKEGALMVVRLQQQLGPKVGQLVVPHRKLIKSGELNRLVITDQEIEKRKVVIHLFNDILIYAIKNKFWRKIPLDEIWVRSKKIEGYDKAFEVYSKSLSCIFIEKLVENNQLSTTTTTTTVTTTNENNIENTNIKNNNNEDWDKLIENTINNWLQKDQKSKDKRVALLGDVQIQKDFTFEERQFYFESLNITRKKKGQSKDANNIIETGIVEDRKKKIEDLISIMNDKRDNSRTSQSSPIASSESNDTLSDLLSDNDNNNNNNNNRSYSEVKKKKKYRSILKTPSSVNFFSPSTIINSSSTLSHIVLTRTGILKQGYLTKIGEVVRNWKRRWFILENGYLFYLKSQSSNKVLGRIPLIGSKVENVSSESRGFNIVTKTRTYFIIADSERDTIEWVSVLNDFFKERENFIASMKQQKMNILESLRSSIGSNSSWQSAIPSPTGKPTSLLRLSIGSSSFSTSLSGSNNSLYSTHQNSSNICQKSIKSKSLKKKQQRQRQNSDQPLSSTEDEYEEYEEDEDSEGECDDCDEDEEEEEEESSNSSEEFEDEDEDDIDNDNFIDTDND